MTARPKIKLQLTTFDWLLELLGWASLIKMWGLLLWNYTGIPNIIPIHFDAAGKPNSYGNKGTLFILPVVAGIIFMLLTFLNRYPHVFNYPVPVTENNALKLYTRGTRLLRYLKSFICFIFLIILYKSIDTATGKASGLGWWFLPLILAAILIPVCYFIVTAFKKT